MAAVRTRLAGDASWESVHSGGWAAHRRRHGRARKCRTQCHREAARTELSSIQYGVAGEGEDNPGRDSGEVAGDTVRVPRCRRVRVAHRMRERRELDVGTCVRAGSRSRGPKGARRVELAPDA